MDSTTMKGTVQGYFDRAFDEMTDKELENPLATAPPFFFPVHACRNPPPGATL